jgi:hypothetical protein
MCHSGHGGGGFMRFIGNCRLAAFAAVALSLGACINSDYDLSTSLTSEFPVKPGTFVKSNDPGTVIVVRREGGAYRVHNPKTKTTTYARLYKIPEYSEYLMQYYDRKKRQIVFLFLKTTDKGFDIYDIEKLPSTVPEHLIKLLKPITESDKRDNNINIVNGKRDTLYIVRELLRPNPKMIVAESYERKP